MEIAATVANSDSEHKVSVRTNDSVRSLAVPAKASGHGSGVNGGEFLMLALATCYCNDLYREAERLGIPVEAAEVEAVADFSGVGTPASNVRYSAKIRSSAPAADIDRLLRETDALAEVHNTVRTAVPVRLQK